MDQQAPNQGHRALAALHGAAGFLDRWVGWQRIGFLLSLSIILAACYALFHLLRGTDIAAVKEALFDTEPKDIALAAMFVAGGYFTLTFYDLFALRTIGRHTVPYRIAALSSFTSYSVGHNLGASVLTGGAVRYRIYSAWGLDAIDVAKLCFLSGLTFWLGNATVLGLGVLFNPVAATSIDHLPLWFNRGLAIVVLIVLATYLHWVWRAPRVIGRDGWRVTLPGGPLTLIQILIGIADLSFCAMAMYILVPDEPQIGFITVAVIFVLATLLGFASHAPGGLGVFDAAMLGALWQFDKEELIAGLLLFRLLYYIVPFTLALLTLGLREITLSILAGRRRRRAHREAALEQAKDAPLESPHPALDRAEKSEA